MDTPALRHLMGAYFHQDWNLDGTEAEVVDSFLTGEPQYALLLAGEIDAVLTEHQTEDQLEKVLDDMGGSYRPDPARGGYRAWLGEVAAHARAAAPGDAR